MDFRQSPINVKHRGINSPWPITRPCVASLIMYIRLVSFQKSEILKPLYPTIQHLVLAELPSCPAFETWLSRPSWRSLNLPTLKTSSTLGPLSPLDLFLLHPGSGSLSRLWSCQKFLRPARIALPSGQAWALVVVISFRHWRFLLQTQTRELSQYLPVLMCGC